MPLRWRRCAANRVTAPPSPVTSAASNTATQLIVWGLIVGARNTSSPYNCTDSKVINSVCGGGWNSEVKIVYDQISNAMRAYSVLPSFVSSLNAPPPTREMTYQNNEIIKNSEGQSDCIETLRIVDDNLFQ